MLALSMVVITGLIGAPGPRPEPRRRAVRSVTSAAAFEAGLAIVILAIILDRLTFAAGEWLDPRVAPDAAPAGRRGSVAVGAPRPASSAPGSLAPFVVDATSFPDAIAVSFRSPVNAIVDWVDGHVLGHHRRRSRTSLTNLVLNPLERCLTTSPWWLVVAVVALIAWSCRAGGRRSSPRSASGSDRPAAASGTTRW